MERRNREQKKGRKVEMRKKEKMREIEILCEPRRVWKVEEKSNRNVNVLF